MKQNFLFIFLFIAFIGSTFSLRAQTNVGSAAAPDPSAMLQVTSSNKGFLGPQIALASTTDANTVASPAVGLLVYNTATAGTAPNSVTPGYYYNGGTVAAPVWTPFNAIALAMANYSSQYSSFLGGLKTSTNIAYGSGAGTWTNNVTAAVPCDQFVAPAASGGPFTASTITGGTTWTPAVFTAPQDGVYYFLNNTSFNWNPTANSFASTAVKGFMYVTPSSGTQFTTISSPYNNLLSGLSTPGGNTQGFTVSACLVLKKGDKISPYFYSFNTGAVSALTMFANFYAFRIL